MRMDDARRCTALALLALAIAAPAARAGDDPTSAPPAPKSPPGPWDRGVRGGGDVAYAPSAAAAHAVR